MSGRVRARNHRACARARRRPVPCQPPPSSRRRERVPLDTRRAITRSHTSHPAPTSSTSETSQRQPPPSAHTLRADARAERATTALAPARGADQFHASRRRAAAAANASLSILAAPSLDHTRAIRHQRRARARRRSGSRRRARTPCAPDARAERATTALAPARASRRRAAAAANASLSTLAAPSLDHTRAIRHQRRARARRRSGRRRRARTPCAPMREPGAQPSRSRPRAASASPMPATAVSVAIQTLPPRYDQAMTAQCAHSARQSASRARNPRARARARRRPAHSRPPPSSCFRKGTLLDNLRAITRSNTSCPARRDTVAAAAVERAPAARPQASRTHIFASHEPFPCLSTQNLPLVDPTVHRKPSSLRHQRTGSRSPTGPRVFISDNTRQKPRWCGRAPPAGRAQGAPHLALGGRKVTNKTHVSQVTRFLVTGKLRFPLLLRCTQLPCAGNSLVHEGTPRKSGSCRDLLR